MCTRPFHWLPPGGSGATRHSRQTAGAPPHHRRQAASMRWSRKNGTAAPPEVCVAAATEGSDPRASLRNLACVSLFLSRSVSPSVSLSSATAADCVLSENFHKIQVNLRSETHLSHDAKTSASISSVSQRDPRRRHEQRE